jgi:hypothetical protein
VQPQTQRAHPAAADPAQRTPQTPSTSSPTLTAIPTAMSQPTEHSMLQTPSESPSPDNRSSSTDNPDSQSPSPSRSDHIHEKDDFKVPRRSRSPCSPARTYRDRRDSDRPKASPRTGRDRFRTLEIYRPPHRTKPRAYEADTNMLEDAGEPLGRSDPRFDPSMHADPLFDPSTHADNAGMSRDAWKEHVCRETDRLIEEVLGEVSCQPEDEMRVA